MKDLSTPLVSIFADNNDYFIPVVELDFFNRKGLHPHVADDVTDWNITDDYKKISEKFNNELKLVKNKKTENAVIRKFTSTIPFKNNSNIPEYFHTGEDYTLNSIDFGALEFSDNLQNEGIYMFLQKLAMKDSNNPSIDFGRVLKFAGNADYNIQTDAADDLKLKLMNAEYLIRYENHEFEDSIYLSNLNCGFIFKNSRKEVIDFVNRNDDVAFTVFKLNDTDFLDISSEITNENVSYDFTTVANAVPHIGDRIIDVKNLDDNKRASLLYFRIDNILEIINSLESFEEVSTFTFFIELFMTGRINQVTNKFKAYEENYGLEDSFKKIRLEDGNVFIPSDKLPKKFRDMGFSRIHVLYSSFDTMIASVPECDSIDFLKEFKLRFSKWTAFSEKFSLSAAIITTEDITQLNDVNLLENRVIIDDEIITWEDL